MSFFDQIKRDDPALRLVSVTMLAGMAILLGGLWWVQVVRGRSYQSHLETQSFRSIRIAAPRGKVLDRNGVALADNRPSYNICLYLEDLRKPFEAEYVKDITAIRAVLKTQREAKEKELGRKLTKTETRAFGISTAHRTAIRQRSYAIAASNIVADISAKLQTPLAFDAAKFTKHYLQTPYQPYPVLNDLKPNQIARFAEQFSGTPGVDLEMQSERLYPSDTVAAHVLGYLRRDNSSVEGEESYYSYRLPDYRGLIGIEGGFDEELRGHAGGKSVLVNNLGYKQSENVWQPTIPGDNAVLTIDMRIQEAAERALRKNGANTRGAIVVMDTQNGDVLALASAPAFNPNHFVQGFPPGEWDRLHDEVQRPEINRATQENYQPGSIFKMVVGLAALEEGLKPANNYSVEPYPGDPIHGCYRVGRRLIKDTAAPGSYDFRRAFSKSSNSYFIHCGLMPGVLEKIIELGRKLHLGECAGLPTRQDTPGRFPTLENVRAGWSDGDTANLCIGQAQLDVTPLQMAVLTSAIANGGTVFWPRLVQQLEPQDPFSTQPPELFKGGRVRDSLGVTGNTLRTMHDAMLADVEDSDGTGRAAAVHGFRIGGKTGTAQVTDARNHLIDHTTWFASYGPWESPRYAVVVMVEGGSSGGGTCAPLAHDIYEVIQKIEQKPPPVAMAH